MKIQPLNDALRFFSQVGPRPEERRQEGRQGSRQNREHNPDRPDDPGLDSEFSEMTQQKLDAAVQGFTEDSQAQANGLSAVTVGKGPGLRVVLTGSDGSVVRQFTGEEFMRLRESVGKGARAPGKILDQKL